MIHAGIGPTHLQNFLAECNLPSISENTLRKKEKELSKQIGEVANTSCRTAQEEEKAQSTNNNVSLININLCLEMKKNNFYFNETWCVTSFLGFNVFSANPNHCFTA